MKKNNNRNQNSKYSDYKHLSFAIIKAATNGDIEAMNSVTQHYGGYIAKLSIRPIKDEYGNERYGVDENIRRELEAKLAAAVLRFKVA